MKWAKNQRFLAIFLENFQNFEEFGTIFRARKTAVIVSCAKFWVKLGVFWRFSWIWSQSIANVHNTHSYEFTFVKFWMQAALSWSYRLRSSKIHFVVGTSFPFWIVLEAWFWTLSRNDCHIFIEILLIFKLLCDELLAVVDDINPNL